MAQRTFKSFSIAASNTAQPVFGTTTSAAVAPGASATTIAVTDSSMFQSGDWAVVDAGASSVERVRVQSVPDSTHITVFGLASKHASGVYVAVGKACAQIVVQEVPGNAGDLYIGTSNLNPTGLVGCVTHLVKVASSAAPASWEIDAHFQNQYDTSEYWIAGTSSDGYLPSFITY